MGTRRPLWLVPLLAVGLLLAGCGGDDESSESAGGSATTVAAPEDTSPEETASSDETATTLPPGATPGLDDLNEDGDPEPTCGTQDYGAGLVLRLPCGPHGYENEVSEGVTLVPNSLFALPGLNVDLTGVSGSAVHARDQAGRKVVVLFISSDTLFDVGSAALGDPAKDTIAGMARVIQQNWPTAPVQLRGHTDATGNAAANQRLSEQRAAAAASYLATQGIDAARISSVGLGPTVPIAMERNPDGSDSEAGRHENRRVEFVVRVP